MRLLREVHELALHYHWSETQILGLPLRRRRAYLQLLEWERDTALAHGLSGER